MQAGTVDHGMRSAVATAAPATTAVWAEGKELSLWRPECGPCQPGAIFAMGRARPVTMRRAEAVEPAREAARRITSAPRAMACARQAAAVKRMAPIPAARGGQSPQREMAVAEWAISRVRSLENHASTGVSKWKAVASTTAASAVAQSMWKRPLSAEEGKEFCGTRIF